MLSINTSPQQRATFSLLVLRTTTTTRTTTFFAFDPLAFMYSKSPQRNLHKNTHQTHALCARQRERERKRRKKERSNITQHAPHQSRPRSVRGVSFLRRFHRDVQEARTTTDGSSCASSSSSRGCATTPRRRTRVVFFPRNEDDDEEYFWDE